MVALLIAVGQRLPIEVSHSLASVERPRIYISKRSIHAYRLLRKRRTVCSLGKACKRRWASTAHETNSNALVLGEVRVLPFVYETCEVVVKRDWIGRGVEVEEDEALIRNVGVNFEEALIKNIPFIR